MSFTPEEERKLRILIEAIPVIDRNQFDNVPILMFDARLGFGTKWCAEQAPAGHKYSDFNCDYFGIPHGSISKGPSAISVDITNNPTFLTMEYGAGSKVPGTTPKLMVLRNLATNPQGTNVGIQFEMFGSPNPVPIRVNGMNVILNVPPRHSVDETIKLVQDYTLSTKGRKLSQAELNFLGSEFVNPPYSDEDIDAIRLEIDKLP